MPRCSAILRYRSPMLVRRIPSRCDRSIETVVLPLPRSPLRTTDRRVCMANHNVPLEHAELVALGVGEHDMVGPAAQLVLLDDGGARGGEPLDRRLYPRPAHPPRLRAPATDLDVQVYPVLDHLVLGHLEERDARQPALGIDERGAVVPLLFGYLVVGEPLWPAGEALGRRRVDVPQRGLPEGGQRAGPVAVDRQRPLRRHAASSSTGNGPGCTIPSRWVARVSATYRSLRPRGDSARIAAGSPTTTLSNSNP